MKIINKTSILGFVIGGILFSFLTSLAYSYNAKDIVYTPSNISWKVGNIKDAIDSIKTTNDTTISNLQQSNNEKTQTIENLNKELNALSVYDKCKWVSTTVLSSSTTSTGQKINLGFRPSKFILYVRGDTIASNIYFTSNYVYGVYINHTQEDSFLVNNFYEFGNGYITIKNWGADSVGSSLYITACE